MLRLLCIAFIFLCAPYLSSAQQPDSLDLRALALEREVFEAESVAEQNGALCRKASVRKQQGLYAEALKELGRVRVYALGAEALGDYYYELALCALLAEEYDAALVAAEEGRFYVADNDALVPIALVEALAAAQVGEWERSERAARTYATHTRGNDALMERALADYYASVPSLRNPMAAYWLSLVPGLGQMYAGEWWSGAVSLVTNGALGAFAVGEVVAAHYLSAWAVGGGLLSQTYFVNMERARLLAERRNTKTLTEYAQKLRTILLQ